MERQKNERIELLEREKRTMEGLNSGYTNFQKKGLQPSAENILLSDKRGAHIHVKRRGPNDKYQISDEIIEDSGEEYYDVAGM